VFWLSGGWTRLNWRKASTAALIAMTIFALKPGDALAQNNAAKASTKAETDFALRATLHTRLAYIVTGNSEVDNVSRTGLEGLSQFLAQRTALEAGEPMAVDPARDELAFFPLLYWPITPEAQKPSPATLAKIDAYMKQG